LKKILFSIFLCLFVFLLPVGVCAGYDAEAMILVEPTTGTVLYEKNADTPMLIASTTKLMTASVVLERCVLSDEITVTAAQAGVEGSSMLLTPGETYTVEELLLGLMLASANNAAVALAEYTAGSVEAFAGLMNERAAALGLANTHFSNPHGLDAEDHYSSARDLAAITADAMKNPTFCRIFSTRTATVHGVVYYNHNKLLSSCSGCIGGKTGYTMAAGRTLVSCAERDGMRLICVTLSDPSDWLDHRAAYDEAFANYRYVTLPLPDWTTLPVISGLQSRVRLRCGDSAVVVPKNAGIEYRVELPRFVFAPVSAGEILGEAAVLADGETILRTPLIAGTSVAPDLNIELSPWERFCRRWSSLFTRSGRDNIIWKAGSE